MIKCKNELCKHNCNKGECSLEDISIGAGAKCENFTKGFLYYFYYLLPKEKSGFLTDIELNNETRYCIHYLMRCLPVVFSYDANRGIIIFADRDDTSKIISIRDIYDMVYSDRMNHNEFNKCAKEFEKYGLPNKNAKEHKKTEYKEYGWLSPTGEFKESTWGTHEESAEAIIEHKDWGEEYNDWLASQEASLRIRFRDFLIHCKGYALIHSPGNVGYIVVEPMTLTRKQRDFLYGYFMDMGMTLRAETYMKE